MAKVTLFFKAINHLVLSFLPREHGHVPTTAKRPVGRPRKRKLSAEAPPVPNIDRASEILLSLSNDVGQEAKWIRCQYTTKHVVMYSRHRGVLGIVEFADRTCLNVQISTPPPYRHPLDQNIVISTPILGALWPCNYFLAAPILR